MAVNAKTASFLALALLLLAPVTLYSQQDEVETAFSLLEQVRAADNFVSKMDALYSVDFPVGIKANDSKEAENYAIIIPEMYIIDGESFITAYMAFKIPGTTKRVAFRGTNIPLSASGGVSGTVSLELVNDFDVELGGGITLILRGMGMSNVRWDCDGFREMEITADVLFSGDLFVPENADGTLGSGELRTTFHTVVNDWNNLLVGISLEPFQIKGLDGFGFSVTEAVFDMSDFRNPSGIIFAPQYMTEYFMEGNPNIWQGLYIMRAEVKLPPWFRLKESGEESSTERITLEARNLYIDELGFTGEIGASHLMSIDEGDLGGWGFSIENFDVLIETNRLTAAGFSGEINVPQLGENSLFGYSALIGLDATYSFTVANEETLEMEMWAAELKIDKNSFMEIALVDGHFVPTLLLNGSLSLNSPVDEADPESPKLSLANLDFQDLVITTVEPYFDIGYLSFGTDQSTFSYFPVSITDVGFANEAERRGLNLGLTVNFTGEADGTFGGAGLFTVWGKREGDRWVYDGVDVGGIIVEIDKGDAFKLYGEVMFMRGDPTYGDGFKGAVDASFAGFGMEATALFGNVDSYRYFYTDALITSSVGIPMGPVALYGFGGGAFYHMRQSIPENSSESTIGRSISGICYTPDKSAGLGLKSSVKLGLSGNANTFNGEVGMEVAFNTGGGINKISFLGNAYFATSNFSCGAVEILQNARHIMAATGGGVKIPKDTENSQLCGDVEMVFDFQAKSFHAAFNVYANIGGGVIIGVGPGGLAGYGAMHFSPEEWYILLGTPDNPNGLRVINIATLSNYFVAGSNVPSIPAPPARVLETLQKNGSSITKGRSELELASGAGIAFGSSFSFDTGERNLLIFYGRFGCDIGFDIMMKNYRGTTCAGGSTIGINGWYAQGQAYSWVKAAVGIKIGLPFYSGTYEIFDMELATLMRAKAPNPVWLQGNVGGYYTVLNGLIKGKCSFDFEIGEQCVPTVSGELEGLSVIAEVKPGEREEEVNVFSTPQAVFTMPIGKNIGINDINGNKTVYRAQLDELVLEGEDGTKIAGSITWNTAKDVALFNPSEILPGETKLKVRASVTFEQYKNGAWIPVTNSGSNGSETVEANFTTGKEPNYVPRENVQYSYPGYGAFNYYPAERNMGYVKLKSGQANLFQPVEGWQQVARITDLTTGQVGETSFRYDVASATIHFDLPTGMVDNNIYRLEIVNIPTGGTGTTDGNIKSRVDVVGIGDENISTDVEITSRYAEAGREEFEETIVYGMEFRCSNFDTFAEKVASQQQTVAAKLDNSYLAVRLSGELFDGYEINTDGRSMVSALPVTEVTDWYTTNFVKLFNLTPSEMAKINIAPFRPSAESVKLRKNTERENLDETEIAVGTPSSTEGNAVLNNYLIGESISYYKEVKNRIAGLYANNPASVTGGLLGILNSPFTMPQMGNYPVKINYSLPGEAQPINSAVMNMVW